ncbi:invasion associated locus B family protein [Qipengyuania sp. ASV99]|uniref:invasion associated locus B family protein n=1 Tax=Qipengyuania sp. ASV99 TaxID=3399681 RepID=UPI003A4C7CAB
MTRLALSLALCTAIAAPLAAKDNLGVYANWAAFRDASPARCYAIAKPQRSRSPGAFASIANWPAQNIRGQLHIRLSRDVRADSDTVLTIADRRFELAANGKDAWARDARMDAAVVAALRSATRMTISARDSSGARFTDQYDLTGAATAIDAAVVGCAS